ncbi:hypothetical protein [Tellurirhabdus rosea]|uniref:hypothetical protein n=1 Tax=Tellurirhabdus rosea TaxID=2674997 RepID=UPI00224E1ACF|nr:hypothetical protein [Tellurirhabdus rosea]
MFKQFIDKIPGADVFMVTSFVTFMVFFVLVGLYLFIVDKNHLKHLANLPLEDSNA